MDQKFSLYSWILVTAAIIAAPLGIYAWKRRTVPGATPFAILMLGGIISSLGYAFQLQSPHLSTNIFWSNVQYLGFTTMPLAVFTLAVQYAGRSEWLTRRRLIWLAIIPLITILLVWTNRLHGLMRKDYYLVPYQSFFVLKKSYGFWFWIHTCFSYLLLTAALVILIEIFLRVPTEYKRQALALLIGIFLVVLGNFLYVIVLRSSLPVDTTLLVNPLAGLIMAWGLFRYQLFDLMPVAHDKVIENMDDGMIVLDGQHRVVDINPSAKSLLGNPNHKLIGKPASQALANWPELIQAVSNHTNAKIELVLNENGFEKYFDVNLSPLTDHREMPIGELILLHEITSQKAVETSLLRLSSTDPLTGLDNRRRFFEVLGEEILHAKRYNLPLSLVILDVDRFKIVNDTFGHQAGDEILCQLAHAIRQGSRKTDYVIRYGGDEFVILMPHTAAADAEKLAKRLLEIDPNIDLKYEVGLGLSAGIATLQPGDDPSGRSLLSRADKALYKAKHSDQNPVLVPEYSPSP